jgi:hypothetical protein
MRNLLRLGYGFILGTVIGCGPKAPDLSNAGTPPPHGGELVAMPGGKGYVEVVKKAGGTTSTRSKEVAFYFLKDADSPLPTPSMGILTVGKKKVDLRVDGDALVTPDGPPLFPKGDLDGILSVQMEGKSVNIPLGSR